MLEVKPEGLASDGERLEYIVREQSRLIGSLHDAGKSLMRLSGLDEARAMLGKEVHFHGEGAGRDTPGVPENRTACSGQSGRNGI